MHTNYWLKISQKTIPFFPLWSVFFLKQNSFLLLWLLLISVSLELSTVAWFTGVFVSLILLRKFTLILPGRHSSSHENKSWRSLYIFLKPWCMKVWCFKLTWWYASISLLILCSFDSGLSQGYFVRLKKNVSWQ